MFHIVGGGIELARLQNQVKEKNLENAIFYGRRPVDEMPKFYSMADAMLVSLTLHGKVQSYMAAGKSIIGAIDGETKTIVEEAQCRFICKSGYSKALAEYILRFRMLSDEDRKQMESNSKSYYRNEFAKDKYFSLLIKNLISKRG